MWMSGNTWSWRQSIEIAFHVSHQWSHYFCALFLPTIMLITCESPFLVQRQSLYLCLKYLGSNFQLFSSMDARLLGSHTVMNTGCWSWNATLTSLILDELSPDEFDLRSSCGWADSIGRNLRNWPFPFYLIRFCAFRFILESTSFSWVCLYQYNILDE